MTGKQIFSDLNKKFLSAGGFDMIDDKVRSKKQAIEKAKRHIFWFRQWAEEAAQNMERELQSHEYPEINP